MASPHIIICFDGSATAKQAIIDTANLHPSPPVVILTAWQPMESYVLAWGVMIGDYARMDAETQQYAHATATEGATLAAAHGLTATSEVVRADTSIARSIIDRSAEDGCQLVVVGSRGRSRVAETFLGSTANGVLHRSHAPVMLVTPHQDAQPSDAVRARDLVDASA